MSDSISIEHAATRFVNYDNPLIAFEFIVIVGLVFAIRSLSFERKEVTAALIKLSETLGTMTEAIRNVQSKK